MVKGKSIRLGKFDDIKLAAETYKQAARKYWGDMVDAPHFDRDRWTISYTRYIKSKMIEAYGGKCVCCGENKYEFLTLDHINGNGNAHRRSLKLASGSQFYKWLEKQGFPKDNYRLLCWNCNCSMGTRGYCPHEKERGRQIIPGFTTA